MCIRDRSWPRLRLGALILLVALVALVFGGIRGISQLRQRYRVNQAVEFAQTAGPGSNWWLNTIDFAIDDNYRALLSDRERVFEILIRSAVDDPEEARRVHSVQTIRVILGPRGSSTLRKRGLNWAIGELAEARLSPAVETELATAIAEWARIEGLNSTQRSVILSKSKSASPALLRAWAHVLTTIGGREEMEFLISIGDTHDPTLLLAVHFSALRGSCWPPLLPALKRWLDDPMVAPHALKYSLLSHSSEGRKLLLAYAIAANHPAKLRQRAVEGLQETIPGTKLLLDAIETPNFRESLANNIGGDPRARFQAALAKLEERNGKEFWSELIGAVDSQYPNQLPSPTTDIEKAVNKAGSRARQESSEQALRCLKWITGRTDLQTQTDWQSWYVTTRTSALAQRELVALVLKHPEALGQVAILRRIVPHHLGELPADCIPLYEQMARNGPPASQYWACMALLHYTPKTDVTPLVINLLSQEQRDNSAKTSSGLLDLLKRRFAENFYWDVPAWREWWAEQDRRP